MINVTMNSPRLFSYKMNADTGFAPNPFFGMLTLATCKPEIRKCKHEGDWIAGFTSKELCNDPVGNERLIYLMQVSRKVPLAQYFFDREFECKIPRVDAPQALQSAGDNIYRPVCADAAEPDDFEQIRNANHWDKANDCPDLYSLRHDVPGRYILVAKQYAYFGGDPLFIPAEIRPQIPRGQSSHGYRTHDPIRANAFIDYVLTKAAGRKVLGAPHRWPRGDTSWQESL